MVTSARSRRRARPDNHALNHSCPPVTSTGTTSTSASGFIGSSVPWVVTTPVNPAPTTRYRRRRARPAPSRRRAVPRRTAGRSSSTRIDEPTAIRDPHDTRCDAPVEATRPPSGFTVPPTRTRHHDAAAGSPTPNRPRSPVPPNIVLRPGSAVDSETPPQRHPPTAPASSGPMPVAGPLGPRRSTGPSAVTPTRPAPIEPDPTGSQPPRHIERSQRHGHRPGPGTTNPPAERPGDS